MENIKNPANIIWLCLILHWFADFHLQGILADMKQQDWWKKQIDLEKDKTYEWKHKALKLYKHDYQAALYVHALEWSAITFLPLMLIVHPMLYAGIVAVNALFHMIVDHMKANVQCISLCADQALHALQVVTSVSMAFAIEQYL